MKIAIFLPAKGSSRRVPSKNMKLMDGKPLFLHTLEKISSISIFDEVWLDSESEEVLAAASYLPVKFMKRDSSLSTNSTDGNKLFINEVNNTDADIVVQILCTSPFIKKETIQKAVDILIENKSFDSVVLVRKDKQYQWENARPLYDLEHIPNSNDLPDTVIETMGLYAMRRNAALDLNKRIGKKPFLLEVSPLEAIDVNYPEDFVLANLIAAGIRESERKLLGNLKTHLSSAMLSDVMDDLNIDENQIVFGLTPNLKDGKLLGRAKTLRLRKLEKGEDYKGIYAALESYKTIVPNDVIVVENEVSEFAYFGELNCNLAIRSGAAGAIIDGKTRDNKNVTDLGFVTFSKGYVARDVRRRATLDSINIPIRLNKARVYPGDLIFADNEGVVVISSKDEDRVLKEVFMRLKNEKNILMDIAEGLPIDYLVNEYGAF